MTHVYFVRHALPEHSWEVDRTRPLTKEGIQDSKKVTEALKDIHFDYAISSPYIRSMSTICECVENHGLELSTDERFRERQRGFKGNVLTTLRKRWEDLEYHEEGGESIGIVQRRNMEALQEVLINHPGETILLGTHATALSSILNYYDPTYDYDSFLRIVNYMPYIIKLDFVGTQCVGKEEILIVDKEFTDYNQGYKSNKSI